MNKLYLIPSAFILMACDGCESSEDISKKRSFLEECLKIEGPKSCGDRWYAYKNHNYPLMLPKIIKQKNNEVTE